MNAVKTKVAMAVNAIAAPAALVIAEKKSLIAMIREVGLGDINPSVEGADAFFPYYVASRTACSGRLLSRNEIVSHLDAYLARAADTPPLADVSTFASMSDFLAMYLMHSRAENALSDFKYAYASAPYHLESVGDIDLFFLQIEREVFREANLIGLAGDERLRLTVHIKINDAFWSLREQRECTAPDADKENSIALALEYADVTEHAVESQLTKRPRAIMAVRMAVEPATPSTAERFKGRLWGNCLESAAEETAADLVQRFDGLSAEISAKELFGSSLYLTLNGIHSAHPRRDEMPEQQSFLLMLGTSGPDLLLPHQMAVHLLDLCDAYKSEFPDCAPLMRAIENFENTFNASSLGQVAVAMRCFARGLYVLSRIGDGETPELVATAWADYHKQQAVHDAEFSKPAKNSSRASHSRRLGAAPATQL